MAEAQKDLELDDQVEAVDSEGQEAPVEEATPEIKAQTTREFVSKLVEDVGKEATQKGEGVDGEAKPPTEKEAAEPNKEEAAPQSQEQSRYKIPVDKEGNALPPSYFSGDAKVNWQRLPPNIRREIAEREATRQELAAAAENVVRAVGSHADVLKRDFGSVGRGLDTILKIREAAVRDPAEFIRWFAVDAGLVSKEDAYAIPRQQAQPQQQQYEQVPTIDPRQLPEIINATINHRTAIAQAQNIVHYMESNPDKYPYLNEVRHIMAKLVKDPELALDHDQAYQRAVIIAGKNPPAPSAPPVSPQRVEAAKTRGKTISGKPGKSGTLTASKLPSTSRGVIEGLINKTITRDDILGID